MSRIGKQPINVPTGVDVKFDDSTITVKGKKGELNLSYNEFMSLKQEGAVLTVIPVDESKLYRKFHGLTRTLINNMMIGVSEGFSKRLTMVGVGYRGAASGKGLNLSLGFSHPVMYNPPTGIEVKMDGNTTIVVSGASKELVGQESATIRSFRPPEPYHGKGVRYENETIITKVGKAAGKK